MLMDYKKDLLRQILAEPRVRFFSLLWLISFLVSLVILLFSSPDSNGPFIGTVVFMISLALLISVILLILIRLGQIMHLRQLMEEDKKEDS